MMSPADVKEHIKEQEKEEQEVKLLPHQERALDFLRKNRFVGYISLPTGRGKTLVGAFALKESNARNALIISPLSAFDSWKRDLKRAGISEDRYRIINIDRFEDEPSEEIKRLAKEIDFLIIDEAHKIKNIKAKRTRNILKLFSWRRIPKVLLSATPVKDLFDVYSQFKLLKPDIFPSWKEFLNTYFREIQVMNRKVYEPLEGAEQQIFEKISHLFYSEDDVVERKKVEYEIFIPTPEEYSWEVFVKEAVIEVKEELETYSENPEDESLFKELLFEKIKGKFIQYWRLASITNEFKHKVIKQLIEQTEKANKKLIIYTFFKDEAEIYMKMTDSYLITGDTSLRKREEILKRQDKHLIITDALSESANLEKYDTMILATIPSTVQKYKQITGRIDRISNIQTVRILKYVLILDEYNLRMRELLKKNENLDAKLKNISKMLSKLRNSKDLEERAFKTLKKLV